MLGFPCERGVCENHTETEITHIASGRAGREPLPTECLRSSHRPTNTASSQLFRSGAAANSALSAAATASAAETPFADGGPAVSCAHEPFAD